MKWEQKEKDLENSISLIKESKEALEARVAELESSNKASEIKITSLEKIIEDWVEELVGVKEAHKHALVQLQSKIDGESPQLAHLVHLQDWLANSEAKNIELKSQV